MIKNGPITIGFVLASICIEYLLSISQKNSLAEILGAALGLIFGPYIITWFIKTINILIKRKFDQDSFFWTFLVTWLIFVLAKFLVINQEGLL
jgi:hypothetical protein